MVNIPIEIAADILFRSPAKTVVRFASVSKAWASLISDPNFTKLHCNQQLQNLKLISRYGHLFSLDLDSLDCALRLDYLLKDSDFTVNKVLGLSDHLLCLSVSSKSIPTLDFDNCTIVICNLSTGARHIVPVESHTDSYDLHNRFSCGFGFDPSGDDYKLVMISRYGYVRYTRDGIYQSQIKVYSMKTKSWTMSNQNPRFRVALKEPVLLDGVLYWVAEDSDSTSSYERHDLIVAFDLARGSFRQVPRPLCPVWKNCLLSFGGKLCVMCDVRDSGGLRLRFYEMEEYGDSVSWTPFASFGYLPFCYDQALTFSKNGDKILVKQQREYNFLCFDLAEETISRRQVHFIKVGGTTGRQFHNYPRHDRG